MFHYLFQARKEGNLTKAELLEEADVLTVGGSDTTAAALTSAIFYLTRDRRVYERLAEEIRGKFSQAEDINVVDLVTCSYLRAVINETLRMSPPGLGDFTRQVMTGGITIDGHVLPEATVVGCSIWSLHHDEIAFGDPWRFRPERWLINETDVNALKAAEDAFFPFSHGTRGCPGKRFALVELSVILALLLYKCDFRAAPGDALGEGSPDMIWGRRHKSQFQSRDFFSSMRDGPMVQFKRRLTA